MGQVVAREGCSVRVRCIGQGALTSPSAVVVAVQSEICRSVIVIEAPTLACTAPPYACSVRDTRTAIVETQRARVSQRGARSRQQSKARLQQVRASALTCD